MSGKYLAQLRRNIRRRARGSERAWARRLRCIECDGSLSKAQEVLKCSGCAAAYPVVLGVPILVRGATIRPSTYQHPRDIIRAVCNSYNILPTAEAFTFLTKLFSNSYHFDDLSLDAENNYLLSRLNLLRNSDRENHRDIIQGSDSVIKYCVVRHYVPSELQAGTRTSRNFRLRNDGDCPIITGTADGPGLPGHVLASCWVTAEGGELQLKGESSAVPVPLLPGRELTMPLHFTPPELPGDYKLRVGLRPAGTSCGWIDPMEIPVTVRDHVNPPFKPLHIIAGPKLSNYDEDHREAIRMLERAVEAHEATIGLEIGGCSTPMTTNLPCEIVNTDIDIQTLQAGRFVFKRRGHRNMRFLCCDAHNLPFQPAAFDFAAIFSALHHCSDPVAVLKSAAKAISPDGFIAVMCEPVGHYGERPDSEMQQELESGINEQRFSLAEYQSMFHDAGLESMDARMDADSLKTILKFRGRS